MEQKNTNSTGLIIFGIIAVAALILAWTAFNRTGEDLENMVAREVEEVYQNSAESVNQTAADAEQSVEEAQDDAVLLAARAEARAEMLAIEARVKAGESLDAVQADIQAVEDNLEQAYIDAEAEASAEWRDIQARFNNIQTGIRNGTADTLEFIGDSIFLLEDEVRVNE